MNTSTSSLSATTAVPVPMPPLAFEEVVCNMVAANLKDNLTKYLSTVPAIPLHAVIVLLLFLRVIKRRFYHLLIIGQCLTDIVALGFVFATHSLCVIFKKLLNNWLLYKTAPIQLILNIYLVVYWKTAIRPQLLLDISFYIISGVSVLICIGDQVFRMYNREPTPIALAFIGSNILGNVALTAVCFSTFFLVRRMNVSYFSEVTLKGQKKMTTALLLEFILILITNICDILNSAINYRVTMDRTTYEFNLASQNVTDKAVLERLKAEFMQQRSTLSHIADQISFYTTFWNAFLPLLRGILIFWAIKPLLQRKTVIVITKSTTDMS